MTTDELTMIVEELGLEPGKKFDLLDRIGTQGVTDALRDEVEKLVQQKIELTQQQHDLIEQAIAEVAKTDAEVAKLAADTEHELMAYEKQAMHDLDTLLEHGKLPAAEPDKAAPAPAPAEPVTPPVEPAAPAGAPSTEGGDQVALLEFDAAADTGRDTAFEQWNAWLNEAQRLWFELQDATPEQGATIEAQWKHAQTQETAWFKAFKGAQE